MDFLLRESVLNLTPEAAVAIYVPEKCQNGKPKLIENSQTFARIDLPNFEDHFHLSQHPDSQDYHSSDRERKSCLNRLRVWGSSHVRLETGC